MAKLVKICIVLLTAKVDELRAELYKEGISEFKIVPDSGGYITMMYLNEPTNKVELIRKCCERSGVINHEDKFKLN